MISEEIRAVVAELQFRGRLTDAQEIKSGHVNRTYCLTFVEPDGQYILQKINSYAFHHPELLMENAGKVTSHLRKKLVESGVSPERRILEFVPARDGRRLVTGADGGSWRAYRYVDGAYAYDRVLKPEHFREAGRAFGEFQRLLADFPAAELHETIPFFHHTPRRFADFVSAVARDEAGRAGAVQEEIDFFFERRKMMGEIVARIDAGVLPLRVTHNDTKINNVLIDAVTEKAICVIDLDTVMPGSTLYDFGDAIRFGAATAAEDEPDIDKIALDMGLFCRFAEGFLGEVNGILLPEEIRLLPLGAKVITCEIGMRFFADYLEGDPYFKTEYPEHNLIRARTQMRLLQDIERHYGDMERVIAALSD